MNEASRALAWLKERLGYDPPVLDEAWPWALALGIGRGPRALPSQECAGLVEKLGAHRVAEIETAARDVWMLTAGLRSRTVAEREALERAILLAQGAQRDLEAALASLKPLQGWQGELSSPPVLLEAASCFVDCALPEIKASLAAYPERKPGRPTDGRVDLVVELAAFLVDPPMASAYERGPLVLLTSALLVSFRLSRLSEWRDAEDDLERRLLGARRNIERRRRGRAPFT